jgi:hypothetical protein
VKQGIHKFEENKSGTIVLVNAVGVMEDNLIVEMMEQLTFWYGMDTRAENIVKIQNTHQVEMRNNNKFVEWVKMVTVINESVTGKPGYSETRQIQMLQYYIASFLNPLSNSTQIPPPSSIHLSLIAISVLSGSSFLLNLASAWAFFLALGLRLTFFFPWRC